MAEPLPVGHWLRVGLQTCDLTFVPGWRGREERGCRRELLAGQGGTAGCWLPLVPSSSPQQAVLSWARRAGVLLARQGTEAQVQGWAGAEVGAMNSLGDYACMSLWAGERKGGRGVVCRESHFEMCPLVSLLQSHLCQERGFALQLPALCRVCSSVPEGARRAGRQPCPLPQPSARLPGTETPALLRRSLLTVVFSSWSQSPESLCRFHGNSLAGGNRFWG